MSGNGVDLGHVVAMLQQVIASQGRQEQRLDDLTRGLNDTNRRLDDLTRGLNDTNRRLDDVAHQVTGLRQTVVHYHSSVLGHGVLITELDERVRRVEQHLGLSPAA